MCAYWGFLNGGDTEVTDDEGYDDITHSWVPGPRHWIMTVEYEHDYLRAGPTGLDHDMLFHSTHSSFSGELEERLRCADSSFPGLLPETIEQLRDYSTETHQERLSQFVSSFFDASTNKWFHREKIFVIVITREAPSRAVAELGDIAYQAVGTDVTQNLTDTSYHLR